MKELYLHNLRRILPISLCLSILIFNTSCIHPNNAATGKSNSDEKQISTDELPTLPDINQIDQEDQLFSTDLSSMPSLNTPDATTDDPPEMENFFSFTYVDDLKNLWYWQEGQTEATQLTTSEDVENVWLNPDGTELVFTRSENEYQVSFWFIKSDGSNEKQLVGSSDFDKMLSPEFPDAFGVIPATVTWIASTQIVAFNTAPVLEIGTVLNDDLWLVDTITAEIRSLIPAGSGGHYVFSPDFEQIAISKPDGICLVNSDGSNRRSNVIIFDPVMTYSEWIYYPDPVWSDDSSYLLTVIPDNNLTSMTERILSLWHIPTDGEKGSMLGEISASSNSYWVKFSPDMSHILYEGPEPGDLVYVGLLHVADTDGNLIKEYKSGSSYYSGWLPDSSTIYYVKMTNGEIYLADTALEEEPELINTMADIREINWINSDTYLILQETESTWKFYLGGIDQPDTEIAEVIKLDSYIYPSYDFTK